MSDNDEYQKEQYAALKYSNEQFDKSLGFIASGSLGISFAFIEKIVNLHTAQNKQFLFSSWYIFSSVIFLSLITHFVSILANRWSIVNVCNENSTPEEVRDYNFTRKVWNTIIRASNVIMIVGIFVGMLFLISFIQHNL